MTMGGNNGGGPFNGNVPSPGNANVGAGNAAALRAAMQQVAQNVGNAGSSTQAGNIAMQGVTGINGLNGLNAKPLITELTKLLKQQATLIENMNKHGAQPAHVQSEEAKFKNFEAALTALKQQQQGAMQNGTQFDPNFINNLANIANIFKNPAVQRVAANLAAAGNNANPGNNPGGNPTPPGTPPTPPTAGGSNNWLGSFFSAFNTAFKNFFGGVNPFSGGGGRGGTPPIPPVPGAPNPGGPGNPNQMASFAADLARLRAMSEEYRNKQKGYIQSNITQDDLKNIKNAVTSSLEGLLQNTSLSNDDKAMALTKFNSAIGRFESAYREQADATKKFVSFASGAITTLQLGQLASKMYLSDPFQYQTMPAINAIGSTGKMGEVMSSALSGSESWKLEQNQTAFGVGSSMMGAGAMMGGKGGAILGLGGAALGLGGLAGGGSAIRDIIGSLTGTMTSDKIKENLTAEKLMNPQTLGDKGNLGKSLYTAFGGNPYMAENAKEGKNFTTLGNYLNSSAAGPGSSGTASGNAYIDKFWKMGMDGTGGKNALSLGMDSDQSGAFLANMAGSLRGKTSDQSMNLANYALKMGTGLGVDPNTYASTFQGMQSVGMTNLKKGYNESLSVFSDAKGEVSQFSANVLQPALMKVTSSLAMRNVSTSADKLSENVNAFQKFLMTDLKGTELGKRAAGDPNIMGQMVNGFADSTAKYTQSTAGVFAARNLLGVNPYDMIRSKTDPEMFMKVLQNGMSSMGINKDMFHTVNGNVQVKNEYGKQFQQFSEMLGQNDFASSEQLVGKIAMGGLDPTQILAEIKKNMGKDGAKVEAAAGAKTGSIANTPEMKVLESMAKQSTEFGKNVQSIQTEISTLQSEVLKYVTNDKFLEDAKRGITAILDKARSLLNDQPVASEASQKSVVTAGAIPATATDIKTDYFKGILNPANGMSPDGKSPKDILRLTTLANEKDVSLKDRREMAEIIKRLSASATKFGNSDFKTLLKPNDALASAKAIVAELGAKPNLLPGNPSLPSIPGAAIAGKAKEIQQQIDGVNWSGLYGNKLNSGKGGTTALDITNINRGDTKKKIEYMKETLDDGERSYMNNSLGINAKSQDFNEDSVLQKIWDKTIAKAKKEPTNKGLQSGLAMLTGVRNMQNGEKKEDLTKLLAMIAANQRGVLSATDVIGSNDNAKMYSGTGAYLGPNPSYSAPNIPVPETKTKPAGQTSAKPASVVSTATGADQVVITIDGQGAAEATRRYIDSKLVNAGGNRKVTP